MRLQWVWLLASFAMLGGLVVPWGDKHVLDETCESRWDQSTYETERSCTADEWDVAYRPMSMETTHTPYVGAEAGEAKGWAYAYADPDAPHQDGLGPLLIFGGPALIASVAVMVVAGVVHQVFQDVRTRTIARAAWGVYAGALLTFLGGMAYHAGTWSAEQIDRLEPGLGLLYGTLPLLAGIPLLPQRTSEGMPSLPSL